VGELIIVWVPYAAVVAAVAPGTQPHELGPQGPRMGGGPSPGPELASNEAERVRREMEQEKQEEARIRKMEEEAERERQRQRERIEAEFEFLPDFPFPRPSRIDFVVRIPPFLLKLVQAFSKVEKILDAFKPDLSIGFGSYIAFPGLWVSKRRGIPTLIHEQNLKVGRANAWLTHWVDRIALSFHGGAMQESPLREFPLRSKITVTGLPLRRALVELAAQTKNGGARAASPLFPTPSRMRLLIAGGSQGSQSLNRLWAEALEHFSDEERLKIAVIHITGENDFEFFQKMYLTKGIDSQVFPFYEEMERLYSEADLALTRAGASTLFELALFGIPAVVVPYPFADAHQEVNARYFEKEEALLCVSEDECTPWRLKQSVCELLDSHGLRKRLSENLRRLACRNAAERLVEVAEEVIARSHPTEETRCF